MVNLLQNQWYINDGRCGICGDPWQGPLVHELGGIYATGNIVKTYIRRQLITVEIQLTTNHGGWFEFRICKIKDPLVEASQECLDKHLLIIKGHRRRYVLQNRISGTFFLTVRLPKRLTCDHCVLQWMYQGGMAFIRR